MVIAIRDDRQMRALTGLSQSQFQELLAVFMVVYHDVQQKAYEKGLEEGKRQRKPGGGAKGKLPELADKLLFVLYYYKTYPTFDVLGAQFDMARSKANENLHNLSPILYLTLVQLGMMPYREFKTPEALCAALKGIDKVIIDATERAYRRPQDKTKQQEYYSGKKKGHTVKNTVMATIEKVIVFLGRTFTGHNHDYQMLKEEFPPELDWLKELVVLVDLGYLGIETDYGAKEIQIPHKKPRKSKKNPDPQLTAQEKANNKAISQIRIFVENAIGGIKRYNILVQRFRNHKNNFDDDVIGICAGLWNFSLSY